MCYHSRSEGKSTLYARISPLGNPSSSITPELDGWVDNGNRVRVGELQRIIHDLRKRRRFSHALEVSEWMNKKGICAFSPIEHAVQLDLIGKVHGFLSAESYFNKLSEQDKTDKTYGALLNCYVRQRKTDKSLSHLQKMKEMGFASTALTYNNIMCLYANAGQHEKVPGVLAEMKQHKVSPDNFSYRICINSYGVKSNIGGIEKILREMEIQPDFVVDWNTYAVIANFYIKGGLADKAIDALKKSEERLDKKDGIGYNHLISLYANLGNTSEIMRLWYLEKSFCKRCINRDYINMLESLVRLGELEEAEKVLKEWEESGNCYDFRVPHTVIDAYFEKDLIEKAETMLKSLLENGKASTPNSLAKVAEAYLDKKNMEKAMETMKTAIILHGENKAWKPNPKVTTGILNWLGDNGSIGEVEAFVDLLRKVSKMNRQMYHALLKATIRGGKEVDQLLSSMSADKINENDDTKNILALRQSGQK